MAKKPELRRALLAQRGALDAASKSKSDRQIGEQILAWWDESKPALVGVYWPMRGEPDLHPAYAALHAKGVRLALPVVVSMHAALKFVEWHPGEAMRDEKFGAQVPAATRDEVFPHALIIPCVGFNRQRFRIGYGGGFYDRTTARVPRPHTLGVAYRFSEVDFEAETFDVALDRLVTESHVLPQ